MTRRIVNGDMGRWSGIVLLLVCTPTTQLHTTYKWESNSTHVFFNPSPASHPNLRKITHKINMRSLPILNDTKKPVSTIQHSTPIFTDDAYTRQDVKLNVVSTEHRVSQRNAAKSLLNIGGGKHLNNSVSNLTDQDNENSELAIGTATATPIKKSMIEESMTSHTNATIVNYQDVSIEQGPYVIMMENITTPDAEISINDSPQYFNTVGKFGNAVNHLKILKQPPTLSRRSEMINIQDIGTGLMSNMDRTTTDDPITDMIYSDKFFATISNSPNVPSSTEQMKIAGDNNKLVLKSRMISFEEISYFSQAGDQEFDVKKEMEPARLRPNNHNDIKNLGRSKLNGMSRLKNSIGRSTVDEKLITTESSVIMDDNSIQQMKQSINYKETIDSSMSNWNNLSETLVKNLDLQLQNMTNTLLIKPLNIQSNEENIPQRIGGGGDVVVEKRSHSDLSDNGLQEAIQKNITYPEMMISINTTTINSDLNTTSSNPYSDDESYITNAKSIFPLINMTRDLTEMLQRNDTYLSSTISSFTPLPYPFDISSSTSFLPIATTPKFDAFTSASGTASGTAEKNFTTFTTSSTIIMNLLNTSDTVQVDDSSAQTLLVDQTTRSTVEYEFIGLSGTTIDYTEVEITSNPGNDMVENNNLNDSNTDTSVEPTVDDSNIPIRYSNIDTTNSIKSDIHLNTMAYTSATDFDLHNHTTLIIDETTTLLSHTTAATSYPLISPSIITGDSRELTLTDASEESTIFDLTDMSAITTSMVSSSAIFEYTIEPETSSTMISSTLTPPENNATIRIINNTTRLVTEEVTMFVRMVIETRWSDVCPQLLALRQAIANVLSAGMNKDMLASQVIFRKSPCTSDIHINSDTESTKAAVPSTLLLYIVGQDGGFDASSTKMLPSLYREFPLKLQNTTIHSFQLVENSDTNNAIAVIVVSCVALICLVLLASLLFVMRKRQARFNYGERCRPVSLDTYSLDSISAFNSVRRKGLMRTSKRSYGNPAFEDSNAIPSHSLNSAGLAAFHTQQNAIFEEFASISQVAVRIDELPNGAEIKNRYANVIPLPETRVPLMMIDNDPLTEYINASYVRGPKNVVKYYIGCQAPIDTTVIDFWRMIWEQQSKVIIMLTDLIENGMEKCAEYIPSSEVTDCYRLYGNFQVTLKKRETKEKYAISMLHLKNLETDTYREISHFWYLWPMDGTQVDAAGLIAVLLEARAVQRGDPGPIVVHCSPGTGRTGTLIALDLGIRQYEKSRTVDVPKIVYTIRRDRAGAVQTKEQYCFIYKALHFYATKLVSGGFESP